MKLNSYVFKVMDSFRLILLQLIKTYHIVGSDHLEAKSMHSLYVLHVVYDRYAAVCSPSTFYSIN